MKSNIPKFESLLGAVDGLLDVKTDDPVQIRRGRLANLVLLVTLSVTLVVFAVALLGTLFAGEADQDVGALLRVVFFGVVLGAAYGLNKQMPSPLAGVSFSLAVLAVNLVLIEARGPLTPSVIGLVLPVLIAGLLSWPGSALLLASLATLGYGWINIQSNSSYVADLLRGGPETATWIVYINLFLVATLAWLFSRMAGRAIRESYERVEALVGRQRGLEAQLEQQRGGLRAAVNVARALIGSRDLDTLLKVSVKQVREQLGDVYQVELYLTDDSGEYVVLRESAGGKVFRMLAKGEKVAVGSLSIVGRAADSISPVLGGNNSERFGLRRPELRKSGYPEVAAPLILGDRLLGVLRLRSDGEGGFQSSFLPSAQSLADQIAIAIENTRLYEETQRSLRELGAMSRKMTRRGWMEFLRNKRRGETGFQFGVVDEARQARQKDIVQRVLEMDRMVAARTVDVDRPGYLAVPMRLRDEVIGVIGVEADDERSWSQDDVATLNSLAERAALVVENARLGEQASRSALRQEMVDEIVEKLQSAPDLRLLLEGVANELKDALGADQVYAEFAVNTARDADEGPLAVEGNADVGVRSGQVVVNGNGPESGQSSEEEQLEEEVEERGSRRKVT